MEFHPIISSFRIYDAAAIKEAITKQAATIQSSFKYTLNPVRDRHFKWCRKLWLNSISSLAGKFMQAEITDCYPTQIISYYIISIKLFLIIHEADSSTGVIFQTRTSRFQFLLFSSMYLKLIAVPSVKLS